MAEIFGVVGVANDLLGLLSEFRQVYDSLSERVEKFRGNREEFDGVMIALSSAFKQMELCETNLQECQKVAPEGSLQYEQINLQSIKQVLELVQDNVHELEKKLLEKRRRFQQFTGAKGIARDLGSQSSKIQDVQNQLRDTIKNLQTFVDENDLFKVDFSSIPRVRFPVHLDFSSPDTVEGTLKTKLLDQVKRLEENKQACHVTSVVGAKGMGGVGKTTALCKLAQERDVQEAFPHGIHFMIVGRDATPGILVQKLKRIVRNSGGKRLADKIDDNGPLESAVATTSSWFSGKRVLFVCDDLWETPASRSGYYNELKELLSECPESHMILSTRNDKIGPQGSAKVVFEPRATTGCAARGMFLESAGLDDERVSASGADNLVIEILELCRGVPLTLSIAGAQVHSHDRAPKESLERLLRYIRKRRLPLLEEESPEEYPCFSETVRGSLEGIGACLEKNFHFMRGLRRHFKHDKSDSSITACEFVMDRFHRLCILPRNARVSEDVVFGAWCISNEQIGWKVLNALKDAHLLIEFEDTKE